MAKKRITKSYASNSKAFGVHAYWTGQIKIALIFMPVHLFTATQRSNTIDLELLDRKTGENIHHVNILENGKYVDEDQIVRG